MGIFELTIDTWTATPQTMICTIVIQSICLIITVVLLVIRVYHICRIKTHLKQSCQFSFLHLSHLFMMLFSLLYLFLYEWNYIHLFLSTNIMECNQWLQSLAISFSFTRILLFAFLMLRSTICFEDTLYAVSSKLTLPVVMISIIAGILLITAIFTQFDGFHAIPNSGICWRTATVIGHGMNSASHGINMILSLVVLMIFCCKVRSVNKEIAILRRNKAMDEYTAELQSEFRKHIKLGTLTVMGTVLLFFCGDLLSAMLGIAYALDQTVNNILTFIMFEEHTDVYRRCCCVFGPHKEGKYVANMIGFESLKKIANTSDSCIVTATCPGSSADSKTTNSVTSTKATSDELEPITQVTAFELR
eukprot:255677_1